MGPTREGLGARGCAVGCSWAHLVPFGIHLFGLDAPLVAYSWFVVFSDATHPGGALLIGLVTWLAYTGDRLVDVLRLPRDADLPIRHQLVRLAAPRLCALLLGGSFAGLLLAYHSLSPERFRQGLLLTAALLGYLSLAQLLPRVFRCVLPREVFVGVFFAAAMGFLLPAGVIDIASLVLFGALCAANAHGVARCERDRDEALGVWSLARILPSSWRSDLVLLGAVLVACLLVPSLWGRELAVAAALELALFAWVGPPLFTVWVADLPLYGAALVIGILR